MIVAHRGSSFQAPENTVASAQLAWRQGCKAVEIDVYLTADDRVMVMHDHSTLRTAGADLDMEKTDSAAIRKLDAGSRKGAAFTGQKVPFFEEIIDTIPSDGILFVELKSDKRIVPFIENIVKNSPKAPQMCFISFDLEAISDMKKSMPLNKAYLLCSTKYNEKTQKYAPYDKNLIGDVKKNNLDGLDLSYKGLTSEFSKQVKDAGFELYVWTVDDCKDARLMKKFGVDGITTNKPVEIKQCL